MKKIFVIICLSTLLFSGKGFSQQNLVDVKSEIFELLKAPSDYHPDHQGIDLRTRTFKTGEIALALLFIDAVKEKYSVNSLQVEAQLRPEYVAKLDSNTEHMFEPFVSEIFSFDTNIKLYYSILPDLTREVLLEQIKIYKFKEIEKLRSELLAAVASRIREEGGEDQTIKEINHRLLRAIYETPGLKASKRVEYIISKAMEKDEDIIELRENITYELELSKTQLRSSFDIRKALLIKAALKQFNFNLKAPYIVWTKFVPQVAHLAEKRLEDLEMRPQVNELQRIYDEQLQMIRSARNNGEKASFLYYITLNKKFKSQFLSRELPVHIMYALSALAETPFEHEIRKDLAAILSWIEPHDLKLAHSRLSQIFNFKSPPMINQLSTIKNSVDKFLEFQHKVENAKFNLNVTLMNGERLNFTRPWSFQAVSATDLSVTKASIKSSRIKSTFNNNAKKNSYEINMRCKGDSYFKIIRSYVLEQRYSSGPVFGEIISCNNGSGLIFRRLGSYASIRGSSHVFPYGTLDFLMAK